MNTFIQSCANVGRLMFRTFVLTPCDYLLFGGQKIFRYSREELEAEVRAELEREGMFVGAAPTSGAASGPSFYPGAADWDHQEWDAPAFDFDPPHMYDKRFDPLVSQFYEFGTTAGSVNGVDQMIASWYDSGD